MKKYLVQSVKILILAGFLVGLSVFAGPTKSFPNGNMAAPINAGANSQIKDGSLAVGGLAVFGTTSGAGLFNDNITLGNIVLGNNANLFISGKLNLGNTPPSGLDLSGEALLNINGTLKTTSLAHPASPFNLMPVCQSGGVLTLCAITPPTAMKGPTVYNSAGNFTFEVPIGVTQITSIQVWGAGGGGGGGGGCKTGDWYGAGGTGGGAGAFAQSGSIAVTAGQNLTVHIPAGGDGGYGGQAGGLSNSGGSGSNGSMVADTTRVVNSAGSYLVSAAGGTSGVGGALNQSGPNGGAGSNGGNANNGGIGGNGGAIAVDNSQGNDGQNGSAPGAGGGGGSGGNCNTWNGHSGGYGGAGAPGKVIINW